MLPSSGRALQGLGRALAYIDWERQEFGIAAALSRDPAMMQIYRASDPYLAFAKLAGAAPDTATKESHPELRERFKVVTLAVGYGITAYGLATRLNIPVVEAEHLLSLHRRCFPVFWEWVEGVLDYAHLNGVIRSRFGWQLRVTDRTKDRSIQNFPCQANGAEMLRLAAMRWQNPATLHVQLLRRASSGSLRCPALGNGETAGGCQDAL